MRTGTIGLAAGLLLSAACVWVESPAQPRPGGEISPDRIREHVFYLAADELEGRATGSEGFDAAMRYVESELADYGASPLFADNGPISDGSATLRDGHVPAAGGDLSIGSRNPARDSYRQNVQLRRVTVHPDGALVVYRGGTAIRVPLLQDFQVLEASPEIPWTGRKGVAFVGMGIHEPDAGWDDLRDLDFEGRCLLMILGSPRAMTGELPDEVWQHYWPWETGIQRKGRSLRGRGLECALVMPSNEPIADWDSLMRNPAALTSRQLIGVPAHERGELQPVVGMLSRETAELLFAGQAHPAMPAGRPRNFVLEDLEVELDLELSATDWVTAANVGALIAGTDPDVADQAILLNAHLDGQGSAGGRILNSANDNASSVAALLEATRALAANPARRPVVVLFPAAEELGLAGSRHFADYPPIPFDHIGLVVNMEMVGKRARAYGDYSFRVTGRLSDDVGTLARQTEQRQGNVAFDYELVYDEPDNLFRNSDHVHFFLRGVPTIYFHSGRGTSVDYHRPTDDAERIDIGKVATMAEILVQLVRATDDAERLPRVNRPRARNLPAR